LATTKISEKTAAIENIKRRIADIDAFELKYISERHSPQARALETKLDKLLHDLFGQDEKALNKYLAAAHLETTPIVMGRRQWPQEVQAGLRKGLDRSRAILSGLAEMFQEDIDYENSAPHTLSHEANDRWAIIHPEITKKCKPLFEPHSWGNAVETGFKVVRKRLRDLTGYEKGTDAFGKGNLKVEGAVATYVEEDFNNAVKFLTMAIDMFRNEKAHTVDSNVDEVRAWHYIVLSSLAMGLLDKAKDRPD